MCGKGKFNDYVITKSSKFGHPHPHLPPPLFGLVQSLWPPISIKRSELNLNPNPPPSPSLHTETVNFVIL